MIYLFLDKLESIFTRSFQCVYDFNGLPYLAMVKKNNNPNRSSIDSDVNKTISYFLTAISGYKNILESIFWYFICLKEVKEQYWSQGNNDLHMRLTGLSKIIFRKSRGLRRFNPKGGGSTMTQAMSLQWISDESSPQQ